MTHFVFIKTDKTQFNWRGFTMWSLHSFDVGVSVLQLDLYIPVSAEPLDWSTAGDKPHQDDAAGVAGTQ